MCTRPLGNGKWNFDELSSHFPTIERQNSPSTDAEENHLPGTGPEHFLGGLPCLCFSMLSETEDQQTQEMRFMPW
jgi:hypothetical protein